MRRRLIAVLLLPLLAAGCGGHPVQPPPFTPSTSAPSSPATSASPHAETAEDFIRRWVEVSNRMQNTGDTGEYRGLVDGCKACISVAADIERIYAAGGFVRTDGWEILSLGGASGPSNKPTVVFIVESHPTQYRPHAGAPIQRFPGGETKHEISLVKRGLSWEVTDLVEVAR